MGSSPILYYLPTCPHCHKVIDFMNANGIDDVEMRNVQEHRYAEELYEISGQTGVPCLVYDGKLALGDTDCITMLEQLVLV